MLGMEGPRQSQPVNLIWLLLGLTEASCCLFDKIQEPRTATLTEKKLGWSCKLGGVEPLWNSKVGHTQVSQNNGVSGMAPPY